MKYGKAIRRWGMAALLGLTIAVLPAVPALALDTPVDAPVNVGRSTVDSDYNFHFDFKGATQGTYWRSKDTSSSSYLRVDGSSGYAPRLYIDGATNSDGNGCTNTTRGGFVRAPGVGKYEIHNNVYEDGFRWARLTGYADRGPGKLWGAWSPDCAGNYTDLN